MSIWALRPKSLVFVFLCSIVIIFGLVGHVKAAAYQVSGRVVDSSSIGIADATIEIIDVSTSTIVASTTSDSSGNYVTSVDYGTYDIRVTPLSGSGYGPATAPTRVIDGDMVVNFILVSPESVNFSGYVYDPNGDPVSNLFVELVNSSTNQSVSTFTSASGSYLMNVLPGNFTLYFIKDTNDGVTLREYYNIHVNNFSLSQSTVLDFTLPLGYVDIHVQNSNGDPVNNVRVIINPASTAQYPFSIGNGIMALGTTSGQAAWTNSLGDRRIALLTYGAGNPYSFAATPPSGSGYAGVTVSNIVVTGDMPLVITLPSPITLSGYIYDPHSNPVDNLYIELRDISTNQATSVATSSSGSYTLNVMPGVFTLTFTKDTNDGVTLREYYNLYVNNFPLTQSSVLDFTLPLGYADIHVQDSDGNPVSNTRVVINPNSSALYSFSVGSDIAALGAAGGQVVWTDSAGNGRIGLLTYGASNPYSFVANPPSGSVYAGVTVSGIVVTGDFTQTITLISPITFSGYIYDPHGAQYRICSLN